MGIQASMHPSRQDGAEDDVFARTGPCHDHCPSQVEQARSGHAETASLLADSPGQLGWQLQPTLFDSGSIATNIENPKGCCRLVDVLEHCPEENVVLFKLHSRSGLGHEVSKWNRRRQRVGVSGHVRTQLSDEQLQAGVIEHEMMTLQQE